MKSIPLVSIFGNIGSGKTSLLERISLACDSIQIVHEPVAKWKELGMLEALYEDLAQTDVSKQKSMPYKFQQMAFATRLADLKTTESSVIAGQPQKSLILADGHVMIDRHIFAEHLFQSLRISESEMNWYNEIYSCWQKIVPMAKPRYFIYLKTNPAACADRIKKRGRIEESNIPQEYLAALDARFEEFVVNESKRCSVPVLTIDASQDEKVVFESVFRFLEKFVS